MAGTIVLDAITDGTGNTVSGSTVVNGSAKAWVNFNGTGTVAIRSSFNVSSITDNGTGDYTVNFTTAMPNANYSIVGTGNLSSSASYWNRTVSAPFATTPTTSSFRLATGAWGTGIEDFEFVYVAIFSS